jgi:phosphate transport system permease protein
VSNSQILIQQDKVYRKRRLINYIGLTIIVALFIVAFLPLFHIVYVTTVNGVKAVSKVGLLEFLTAPPNPTNPQNPGGIGPALVGTLVLVVLTTVFAVLLALPAGVFIAEFRDSGMSRLTLLLALILMEFPTVLIGLTVYAIFVERIVGRYNMLAGAIALTIVVLPYMIVQISEALRHIPYNLREAAFSIGLTRFKTIYKILVPVARRGILVGVLIGLAKAAGETAPLLFTIGGAYKVVPESLLEEGGAVPLLIYHYIQQPSEAYHVLAWGAAFILMLIVMGVMLVSRAVVKEVRL